MSLYFFMYVHLIPRSFTLLLGIRVPLLLHIRKHYFPIFSFHLQVSRTLSLFGTTRLRLSLSLPRATSPVFMGLLWCRLFVAAPAPSLERSWFLHLTPLYRGSTTPSTCHALACNFIQVLFSICLRSSWRVWWFFKASQLFFQSHSWMTGVWNNLSL